MIRLLVLIGLITVCVFVYRSMRAGIREARTGGLPPIQPTPMPVGRHAWRIDEQQTKRAVVIEVAHPTKGTRRRWEIERALPDFEQLLAQARADAEELHGRLAGSQP